LSNEFIGEGTPLEDIPESTPERITEDMMSKYSEDFGTIKSYKKGDIISGRIVEIRDDVIMLDIQTKCEGILPKEEISFAPNPTTAGFNVGQEFEVMVIKESEDSCFLSKRRVDERKIWERVAEANQHNKRMDGKIIAAVNGGLIIDIGGRAFLPQSQIDLKKIDDLESLIGQDIEVKVLEFDKEKNRLVVSRKLCIEEDLEKVKLDAFDSFRKGQVIEGKIEKLVDYGAFVNLGPGITGLLHVSEMSWDRVENPKELFKIGEIIQVKVLKIDREKKKISLSHKSTLPEPWDVVHEKYKPGDIVDGIVTRTASFGIFVKLDNYFEGLAHISELTDQRISHAKEVFEPGNKVSVLILDVDRKRKRIRLSVKKASERQTEHEVKSFLKHQGELQNTLGARFGDTLMDLAIEGESQTPEKETPQTKSSDGDASGPDVLIEDS